MYTNYINHLLGVSNGVFLLSFAFWHWDDPQLTPRIAARETKKISTARLALDDQTQKLMG